MIRRITKDLFIDLGAMKPVTATVYADVSGVKVKIIEVIASFQNKNGSAQIRDILPDLRPLYVLELEARLSDPSGASDAIEWEPDGAA